MMVLTGMRSQRIQEANTESDIRIRFNLNAVCRRIEMHPSRKVIALRRSME
jgi:hypothetical protein